MSILPPIRVKLKLLTSGDLIVLNGLIPGKTIGYIHDGTIWLSYVIGDRFSYVVGGIERKIARPVRLPGGGFHLVSITRQLDPARGHHRDELDSIEVEV